MAEQIKHLNLKINTIPFLKKIKYYKKTCRCQLQFINGNDTGSPFQIAGFNVHEEMLLWAKTGISNYQILRAATIVPAQFFGQDKKWGSIEIGKDGNVIILEKNPSQNILNIGTVETTICNGNVYAKKVVLNSL